MAYNTLTTSAQFVSFDGPPYLEMARQGALWNTIGAAQTNLAAFPTTTANLELWNNTNSGMTMVIVDLSLLEVLRATAVLHNPSLWAMVTAPKAAPTLSALLIGSLSGRFPYTSSAGARVVTAQASTGLTANGWRPWGQPGSGQVATNTPGVAFSAVVDGKLIVPPGCSICVSGVDVLAEASMQVGVTWYEVPNVSATGVFANVA